MRARAVAQLRIQRRTKIVAVEVLCLCPEQRWRVEESCPIGGIQRRRERKNETVVVQVPVIAPQVILKIQISAEPTVHLLPRLCHIRIAAPAQLTEIAACGSKMMQSQVCARQLKTCPLAFGICLLRLSRQHSR